MTTPAELETWLCDLFTTATVESDRIDRRPDLSFGPVVLEELHEYYLFRIERPGSPRIQVGVTSKALEGTPLPSLHERLRRAIDSATRGASEGDVRFIVTSADVIVREPERRRRQ